jgi:2-(1,2-epoxy-1,2-dihydrophenyl)acetyl-CoA isomerase
MTSPAVLLDIQGAVAVITLNRQTAANTLDLEAAKELLSIAKQCHARSDVRAMVLTGAGKHFCFGGDLRSMREQGAGVRDYLLELTKSLHAAIVEFARIDAPLIAAVNGTAAGAGVGLVAMSDLALCARSSKFNLAYTGVALTPDAGTSFLLPRAVGTKRAMELLLLNRVLLATEALDWGLVNGIVEDPELLEKAVELARRLANGPAGAFGKTKRLVRDSLEAFEHHLATESETIAAQAITEEGQEGIQAFLQKRTPRWAR